MMGNGSGRGAIWYGGNPERILAGVRTEDPPRKPKPNWNKRRWIATPFGLISSAEHVVRRDL